MKGNTKLQKAATKKNNVCANTNIIDKVSCAYTFLSISERNANPTIIVIINNPQLNMLKRLSSFLSYGKTSTRIKKNVNAVKTAKKS